MYHTTGLSREQVEDIVARVAARHPELVITGRSRGGNQRLGFFRRVHLAICYLKLNTCQAALAEFFETSQPTASRVICAITDAVVDALGHLVPTGDDLDPDEQLIVDGTLLPRLSWHDHRELYSGKHHTTGHNIQVAARADGTLMWVLRPAARIGPRQPRAARVRNPRNHPRRCAVVLHRRQGISRPGDAHPDAQTDRRPPHR